MRQPGVLLATALLSRAARAEAPYNPLTCCGFDMDMMLHRIA